MCKIVDKRETGSLIAVTGGIGSGKSVVSRMLRCMGFAVYDCDSRARRLMDADDGIKRVIAEEICREAVTPAGIDRRVLSDAVFSDTVLLERLNHAVHESVRSNLRRWAVGRRLAFVETAILYQSSLDRMVDEVWTVEAPVEMRIRRVMARSALSRRQVEQRVALQDGYDPCRRHSRVETIVNDGIVPLLPRILSLLDKV